MSDVRQQTPQPIVTRERDVSLERTLRHARATGTPAPFAVGPTPLRPSGFAGQSATTYDIYQSRSRAELLDALQRLINYSWGRRHQQPIASIPVDQLRDADAILADGINELDTLRSDLAALQEYAAKLEALVPDARVDALDTLPEHRSVAGLWPIVEAMANLSPVATDDRAYVCLCCSALVEWVEYASRDLDERQQLARAARILARRHDVLCPVGHAQQLVAARRAEP